MNKYKTAITCNIYNTAKTCNIYTTTKTAKTCNIYNTTKTAKTCTPNRYALIMWWWGMRFCELCSLSTYNVFRVETSLRRLHDNSIVEFPNWHVPVANGLGNQTTIPQQTHCGEIMCSQGVSTNSPVRMYWTLCFKECTFVFIIAYFKARYPSNTATVRLSMPRRCLLNVDVSQLWPGILVTHRLRHPSVLFSPPLPLS